MPTSVVNQSVSAAPFGSIEGGRIIGASVFAEATTANTICNCMTGPEPTEADAADKLRIQSSPDYPIVRIRDLEKGSAGEVRVDSFNILEGLPVMGDARIGGRLMSLSSSSMTIRIDQIRGGADLGGNMARQRTSHNLRTIGRAGLEGWWKRYLDQCKIVHMAGARGDFNTSHCVIPLAGHPEFAGIMVNQVMAPTYNRHFYGGDASSIADIDPADLMTLDTVSKLRTQLDESDIPLQPVKFYDDPQAEMNPLFILMVTPRQWRTLQSNSSDKDWHTFLSAAGVRGSKNPLFTGDTSGMWDGILIRKMENYPTRFKQGSSIKVATNADAYAETTTVVPTYNADPNATVDRAILLGGQAIGEVWGIQSATGTHFRWYEGKTDHGSVLEASISSIGGFGKFRFKNARGQDYDHGVAVIDTYAPSPR
ncbi:MAG: DUF4043 family protein [Magnetococcales bacterium]|nr:DUF4043 family protein [Magnetococcales bacterium]